jgi:hypothetical protein
LHDRRAGERHRREKTDETGANVSPGRQLMAVVPLDDIWITTDFKETQLRLMKPCDRVSFSVDAYGREYRSKVTGVGGASGSRLCLPPENATGHFVNAVQRILVRIDIDPNQNSDHRPRPGAKKSLGLSMSVPPNRARLHNVYRDGTHLDRTHPSRALFDPAVRCYRSLTHVRSDLTSGRLFHSRGSSVKPPTHIADMSVSTAARGCGLSVI